MVYPIALLLYQPSHFFIYSSIHTYIYIPTYMFRKAHKALQKEAFGQRP